MGVGAGAGATQGVLGNTGTSSAVERRGVADDDARVPVVLSIFSFCRGVTFPRERRHVSDHGVW